MSLDILGGKLLINIAELLMDSVDFLNTRVELLL
jgi:hypothetical protein